MRERDESHNGAAMGANDGSVVSPILVASAPSDYVAATIRLCVFLVIFVGVLVLANGQTRNDAALLVVPGLTIAAALYLLPVFVTSGADLFSPVAYTGLYDGLGLLAGLAAILVTGRFELGPFASLGIERQISLVNMVCTLHIVSRLGYLGGYYSYRAFGIPLHEAFPNLTGRVWQRERLYVALVLLTAIFVATYAVFQSRLDASLFDITQLRAGKAVWREDQTLSWMVRGVLMGLMPATLFFTWALHHPTRLRIAAATVIFFIVTLLVIRMGQRGAPAFAGVVLLILFHYLRRPIPVPLFFVGFFALLVAMNVLGDIRENPDADVGRSAVASFENPVGAMASHEGDRQRVTGLAVIMYFFPDHKDLLLGKSWAGIFGLFIPRWLWPEKTASLVWSDSGLIYSLVGLPIPASLPGLLFANFSWAGVVAGMGLWGFFHRALYEWLRQSRGDLNVVLMYGLLLVHFVPMMLPLAATIQYVIPGFFAVLFVSRRVRGGGITSSEHRRNKAGALRVGSLAPTEGPKGY